MIGGWGVTRLLFNFVAVVDDKWVGDDVFLTALNVVRHILEEAPVDVVVDIEVVVGLLDPIPQIMGDVEADGVYFLRFVEEFDGVVVLHDSLFRHAHKLLSAVDQGRNLIGDGLAIGAKFLVPWLRIAVETGRRAGAGDGGRRNGSGSHLCSAGTI